MHACTSRRLFIRRGREAVGEGDMLTSSIRQKQPSVLSCDIPVREAVYRKRWSNLKATFYALAGSATAVPCLKPGLRSLDACNISLYTIQRSRLKQTRT